MTASPVAKVESLSSTTTSPDSTPARASRPSSPDGVERREPGADGALGVVLVRLRDSERGHDGVARELLDDAAVRGHAVRDTLEELRHPPARDLGVCTGDQRRRIDEVDKEDGCQLSFHGRKCKNDRGAVKSPENPAFKPKNAVRAAPLAS